MKRWMLHILIFLLLGAVVNVLVAWGALNTGTCFFGVLVISYGKDHYSTEADVLADLGDTRLDPDLSWARRWCDPAIIRQDPEVGAVFSLDEVDVGFRVRSYGIIHWGTGLYSDCVLFGERTDCGWPLYAFHGFEVGFGWQGEYFDLEWDDEASGADGAEMEVGPGWTRLWDKPRKWSPFKYDVRRWNYMVYLLNWPGLIINTLFYAVLLWLLWCTPFSVRRFVRRRRGRCPRCNYDLRGELDAGCTECGWKRQ